MTALGTDEQIDEASKAEREDKRLVAAMKDMVRTEAWKYYHALLDRRADALGSELLEPLKPELYAGERQEYIKGTMRGLILARDLPEVIIATNRDMSAPAEQEREDADTPDQ